MKEKTNKELIKTLEDEIKTLSDEIKAKEQKLQLLQTLVIEFKKSGSYDDLNNQYNILSEQNEKEKERLVKLHYLYKKMEADHIKLKNELHEWREWFDNHGDLLNKLSSSAPQKKKQTMTVRAAKKKSIKNKRRIRLFNRIKSLRTKRKSSTPF